jgi:hypothetical protein
MPEPRGPSAAAHASLPSSHLSKDQPDARGYATSPCSAGKRRVIVAKAVGNKPLFATATGINLHK